jgi:hypothetical protein
MQSSEELGSTFGRAWQLLTDNWIIAVPGIIIGIAAAMVIAVLGMFGIGAAVGLGSMGMGGAGLGSAMLAGLAVGLVGLLAVMLNVAYTTGMAGAAWRTGKASFSDGAEAIATESLNIIAAIVLLVAIGIVAVVLMPFTVGLSLLAYAIFFLYTFAAVIVGQTSATEAIGRSCRLAARNFLMTLAVVVILAIAFLCASWVERLLHGVPVLGSVASYVIQQVVAAYATLVVVGEYLKLRVPAAPPAAPPTA